MKIFLTALKMLVAMTVLTGGLYPLLISGISGLFFPQQAGGSILSRDGRPVGSNLVGQKFTDPKYFWPRPSAVDYNPMPSSGSNLGPTSAALKDLIASRKSQLEASNPESGEVPIDLLCASGSGLDPHISPAAARYQAARVAVARGLDPSAKTAILNLIDKYTEAPDLGFLGEPRINVLKLNIALDSLAGAMR